MSHAALERPTPAHLVTPRTDVRAVLAACLALSLAACDTDAPGAGPEPGPFDGFASGVANGAPFADSVQVRVQPGSVDIDAPLPRVPGAQCGLSASPTLDPQPDVRDLRRSGDGLDTRGLLVVEGGGDAVCTFLTPTEDEGNRIVFEAGSRPGEPAGTFAFVVVADGGRGGLDTLRVTDGRIAFTTRPTGRPSLLP